MSSATLRIAQLIGTPGTTWGGMEKHVLDLARGLVARGHEVHVMADGRYGDRFAECAHFHPVPVNLSRRHPWLGLRLRRLLRRIQPDICHAHGNKAAQLLGNVKRRQGSTRAAYVATLHGTKSSHQAFSKMDGVIAVSEEIAANLQHPVKQVIFNGGALADTHTPTDRPIPDATPLLVAAGRLEPVKGFDRLIDAWAAIQPSEGHLVILGEGRERSRLEALIASQGLPDRITLPGFESNVAGWLNRADACVISSAREGFPYILTESLLSCCPVLSTPVSGVDAFLPASSIASSHDRHALAELLRTALSDLDALRRSQEPAFARAASQLTVDGMVEQTLAFYQALSQPAHPGAEGHR